MNFGEMQAEIRQRLDEAAANYWSDRDVRDALNEAYEEVSDATEWYETSDAVALTASGTYYDARQQLTRILLAPGRAQNLVTDKWLEAVDVRDLDLHTYRQWELVTGEPEKVFIRGLWWIGVYPMPANGNSSIRLYYTAIPNVMSAPGDTPAFPEEFHLSLVNYAMYDLLVQDGEVKKGLRYWKEYQAIEEALRRYVKSRISIDRVDRYV